jgi:hypothetical protein
LLLGSAVCPVRKPSANSRNADSFDNLSIAYCSSLLASVAGEVGKILDSHIAALSENGDLSGAGGEEGLWLRHLQGRSQELRKTTACSHVTQ